MTAGMIGAGHAGDSVEMQVRAGRWRFGNATLDGGALELRVDDAPVAIEPKALALLLALLRRPGEVVTKDELLDAVWAGRVVTEGVLVKAVAKVRAALGDADGTLVRAVHGYGYRLVAEVTLLPPAAAPLSDLDLDAGQPIPGRPNWIVERALGEGGHGEVWLAAHAKTHERRVFKFARDGAGLTALKREITLFRLLNDTLGERADLVPILDWNLEEPPYFLESAWSPAGSLLDWSEAIGGIDTVPLPQRLELVAEAADALAAAHGVGVLHKDIKPSNVLVAAQGEGWRTRLTDFGNSRLLNPERLAELGITSLGLTTTRTDTSGTPLYLAPELIAGQSASIRSDLYALGVVLYQLVVGDLHQPLAPGWERSIDDELLCADIARATDLDPARRHASVAELAQQLRQLEARRAEQQQRQQAEREAATLRQALERSRARRPWVRTAVASLTIGLLASSTLAGLALHQRNKALEARQLSDASYRFLAEDLLGSIDPSNASTAEETLVQAITRTGDTIPQRFGNQPQVMGHLHATLARAFDLRSDYANAFRYYALAEQDYRQAGLGDSPQALNARLQHAGALALSTQPGSLEQARKLVEDAQASIAAHRIDDAETRVWLEAALGMIALAGEDVLTARDHYARAHEGAAALPQVFSPRQIAKFSQRHAFSLLRLGDGEAAERVFRDLLEQTRALMGADHPDTLLLRLNLGQAVMIQQRHAEAIALFSELLPVMEQRLGKEHRHTLLTLSARQQALGSSGRYAEAAADGERVWQAAARKDGPSSFSAVALRTDTGISQCRAGQLDAGAANIRAALDALVQDLTGRQGLHDAVRAALADCRIQQRRFDEAAKLLENVDREKVAQLIGDPSFGALVDLALAEIALGRGDLPRAQSLFAAASDALKNTQDIFVGNRITSLRTALAAP